MKRRQPFNEIRAMGHICEGMVINEPAIQHVAECQHGSLWFEREIYSVSTNPRIKNDEELMDILSSMDDHPWDIHRLSRLRSGLSHLSSDIRLVEKRKRDAARRVRDRQLKRKLEKERKERERIGRENLAFYKMQDAKRVVLETEDKIIEKPIDCNIDLKSTLESALDRAFSDENGNPIIPMPHIPFKYTIFGQ